MQAAGYLNLRVRIVNFRIGRYRIGSAPGAKSTGSMSARVRSGMDVTVNRALRRPAAPMLLVTTEEDRQPAREIAEWLPHETTTRIADVSPILTAAEVRIL